MRVAWRTTERTRDKSFLRILTASIRAEVEGSSHRVLHYLLHHFGSITDRPAAVYETMRSILLRLDGHLHDAVKSQERQDSYLSRNGFRCFSVRSLIAYWPR